MLNIGNLSDPFTRAGDPWKYDQGSVGAWASVILYPGCNTDQATSFVNQTAAAVALQIIIGGYVDLSVNVFSSKLVTTML